MSYQSTAYIASLQKIEFSLIRTIPNIAAHS